MNNTVLEENIAKEIIENNLRCEYETFSKYACYSNQAERFKEGKVPDKTNIRPAFFHDTDRIIHSLAYTRYIDKTQVFYLFENDHITHRVLHVQLVSKIARVIGRALSLNEDLIDAIALGHDLGHVPYGHDGERKLDELLNKQTGEHFCHNAQSVRALQMLENKGEGLNLSLQVLDGILCHNGELMLKEYKPDYSKTKERFFQEYNNCWSVKGASKSIISMTLEGCVMRISDVIAYIGRDLEDAITLGLIKRVDIPKSITDIIGNTNASIINNFALDIINNSYGKDFIKLSDEKFEAIKEFYEFSTKNIYQNPKKSHQDEKIKNMFDVLFKIYLNDLESGIGISSISKFYLPNMNEDYLKNYSNPKIVCDYIAGMTDDFFNKEFKDVMIPHSFGYKV
ncbi:deoxyguanosinetriphosphate triphosphohydrolase family protein [Ancylomarina sp. 16SWW S1-10-2]|uniref:deoxyguanosinetriphosphate triphosphohydrolase family protein n=1 Tax=Ancylomarina sp. 16SWW S1-10-2 TaxID=2499681 RepID=UPI0012AD2A03|nr:HD domain-containing protein [Ancylomarina sp. 16SWW S1-10-2]MRT91567.1 HD domain-containing protein [Ancylomarina sp. 16SWW S1-10-2]